jgi:hypothetical protein
LSTSFSMLWFLDSSLFRILIVIWTKRVPFSVKPWAKWLPCLSIANKLLNKIRAPYNCKIINSKKVTKTQRRKILRRSS